MEATQVGLTLLWMTIILLATKLATLVERIGQPPVLGELLVARRHAPTAEEQTMPTVVGH